MSDPAIHVRRLDTGVPAELELVAERMRETLVEVLGRSRALALYSMDQLRERVGWHLDPSRKAAVFVGIRREVIVGHTVVRVELEDGGEVGLFSTTYVAPEARRAGVASALLARGEAWIRDAGQSQAVSYTDSENVKLIELYRRHGYAADTNGEWTRLSRDLSATG